MTLAETVKNWPTLSTATPEESSEYAREIAQAWAEKRQVTNPKTLWYLATVICTMEGLLESVAAPGTFPYPKAPGQTVETPKPIKVDED